ncbi:hypothetical protein ACQEU5_06560 [Marinactinospora thermotolerans]|uniref:hypothetical protein n=1 Tax=Marinactinospora thermotolerans TaxID=531310 RepID=UPI003D94177F
MSYDVSGHTRPQSVPARSATALAPAPTAADLSASLAGIGDISMAGHRSGYAHLDTRPSPTVGRLSAAARGAAEALSRPSLWPRRRGVWQPAPRTVRRRADGRMRVAVVTLDPDQFVSLPAARDRSASAEVLHLVHGRAHTVATSEDGRMLAVQRLGDGRIRVLGTAEGHQLVNTGTETAVVVRVSG